jgi:hypothetical protein
MAFTSTTKLKEWTPDAPGMGIFARSTNREFYIAEEQEVEFYYIVESGAAPGTAIATGFDMVKGGYFFNVTDNVSSNVIDVKPGATDPTAALVSGVPAAAKNYIAVIFGVKSTKTLTT